MFAPLLLAAAFVQPAPAAAPPPPFGGIVAVGDHVVVSRRDGVAAVRVLSAAEAQALQDGQDGVAERAMEELRAGLKEFGVELSENPSRQQIIEAFREAGEAQRGGVVIRGEDRRDLDAVRERGRTLNELQAVLRASLASRASGPQPVLAVSAEWLTLRTEGNEVTHLPLHQVGSLTESAARYAERTGTALVEEPAIEPTADDAK